MFLANPELQDEMNDVIDKYSEEDEEIINSPVTGNPSNVQSPLTSPPKGASTDPKDLLSPGSPEDENRGPTSRFWGSISKEMAKTAKSSKMPNLNQINHHLSIFKTSIDKPEASTLLHKSMSTKNRSLADLKSPKSLKNLRVQSANPNAKNTQSNKELNRGQQDPEKQDPGNPDEEEDGIKYYSFRRKMHLKLKQKRIQRELEEKEERRGKLEEQKEMERQRVNAMVMSSIAELDREMVQRQKHNQSKTVIS